MRNYCEIIKSKIKINEWVCFGDVLKRTRCSEYGSTTTKYYRAWQDLKINGILQLGVSGLYRINQ